MSALEGGADIECGCLTLPLLDPTRTLDAAFTRGAARPSMSGGELENFLHLQEVGLINNPQGASLTLGADLHGLQLPCVTLLPTSPASLKSRTIGSTGTPIARCRWRTRCNRESGPLAWSAWSMVQLTFTPVALFKNSARRLRRHKGVNQPRWIFCDSTLETVL
jgi:hypothetical protein